MSVSGASNAGSILSFRQATPTVGTVGGFSAKCSSNGAPQNVKENSSPQLAEDLRACLEQISVFEEENQVLRSLLPAETVEQFDRISGNLDTKHSFSDARETVERRWSHLFDGTGSHSIASDGMGYGQNHAEAPDSTQAMMSANRLEALWVLSAWTHVLTVLASTKGPEGVMGKVGEEDRSQPFATHIAREALRRGRELLTFEVQFRKLKQSYEEWRVQAVSAILRSQQGFSDAGEEDELCRKMLSHRVQLALSHQRRVAAAVRYQERRAAFDHVTERFLAISAHELFEGRLVRSAQGDAELSTSVERVTQRLQRLSTIAKDLSVGVNADCAGVGSTWDAEVEMMDTWLKTMVDSYHTTQRFYTVSFTDAKKLLATNSTLHDVSVVQNRGEAMYHELEGEMDAVCASFTIRRPEKIAQAGKPLEISTQTAFRSSTPKRRTSRSSRSPSRLSSHSPNSLPDAPEPFNAADLSPIEISDAELHYDPQASVAPEEEENNDAVVAPKKRRASSRRAKRAKSVSQPVEPPHTLQSHPSQKSVKLSRDASPESVPAATNKLARHPVATDTQFFQSQRRRAVAEALLAQNQHNVPREVSMPQPEPEDIKPRRMSPWPVAHNAGHRVSVDGFDPAFGQGHINPPSPHGTVPQPFNLRSGTRQPAKVRMSMRALQQYIDQYVTMSRIPVPSNFGPVRDRSKSPGSIQRELDASRPADEIPYYFGNRRIIIRLNSLLDGTQVVVRTGNGFVTLREYCRVHAR